MSTDYYFVCHKHKQSIHVAQDGVGGFSFYSGEPKCMAALKKFLKGHSLGDCRVEFVNEAVEDYWGFDEVEWNDPEEMKP